MKNIQVIDGAENATFSLFQATDEEFALIFPGPGQDIEFIEDFLKRAGEQQAGAVLKPIWQRPIRKSDASGLHGTLFFEWEKRRKHFPASKREIDTPSHAINAAQRALFARLGGQPAEGGLP